MGCEASNFFRKTSAGGQLEQPSEVKSSMRTGVACGDLSGSIALPACGSWAPRENTTFENNKQQNTTADAGANANANDRPRDSRDTFIILPAVPPGTQATHHAMTLLNF